VEEDLEKLGVQEWKGISSGSKEMERYCDGSQNY